MFYFFLLSQDAAIVILGSIVLISIAFFGSFASRDLCVCLHPREYSTRFTRDLEGPSCVPQTLCLAYLTAAEDMSNSVIVNFHANTATFARASVTFRLGDAHGELFREYNATCAHVDSIDEEQRVVCWADATQLQPGQTYSIDVKLFADEQQTTPFARGPHLLPVDPSLLTYRVPDPSKPITFIAGGDYQVGPDARALTKFAMLHKPQPSFAMLGGDVTYSNAIKTCYRRYDRFFREWYEVASSVPLIVSPGNHDAGSYFIGGEIDSKKLNVVARRRDVPFYIRYFPQHTNLQSTPINDRLTYHSHKLGNLISVLSIDA